MDWILGIVEFNAIFMWLYGQVGAGKSTIAQTLAELCAREHRLLGSFFFFRTGARRSSVDSLVATIAYHVATVVPQLQTIISSIIEKDPLIFQKSFKVQFTTLLIDPINSLSDEDRLFMPNVIIIDGLDECVDREEQRHILKVLSETVLECSIGLRILIVSRPEVEIQGAFNSDSLRPLSTRLALDNSFKPDDDILHFLKSAFTEIVKTHCIRIPSSWPGTRILTELVRKSSGQFIYASTVARYVASPRHSPMERLDIILGLHPCPSHENLPFAQMDTLYTHLFSIFTPEDMKDVLRILGLFVCENLKTGDMSTTAQVADLLSLKIERVDLLIGGLASVLDVEEREWGNKIRITHASLADFLLDERRSKQFRIDSQQFTIELVQACLTRFKFEIDENNECECLLTDE